jgi:curli biogenesis system outer membrane secretion channel CsgG
MKLKKRIILMLALICAIAQFGAFTAVYAQRKGGGRDNSAEEKPKKGGKPRVIVAADASSNSSWTREITEAELETALVQSGRFIVIAGAARDKLLQEQKFSQSDLVDPAKATEVGKLLTADYMVVGKCINAEEKSGGFSAFGVNSKKSKMNVSVQIQLYNMTSGQLSDSEQFNDKTEVNSTSVSGVGSNQAELPKNDAYREMMKRFAGQFVNKMSLSIPISALVVLVRGNEVAIDAGESASVKPGMEFEVFSEGEPIRDAAGEVLSYDRSVHGKIRVTRVEPKLSWAEVVQTYNNNQPDPSPNPARIQRDFAVKQLNMSAPPPTGSTGDTSGKKKKKDKE